MRAVQHQHGTRRARVANLQLWGTQPVPPPPAALPPIVQAPRRLHRPVCGRQAVVTQSTRHTPGAPVTMPGLAVAARRILHTRRATPSPAMASTRHCSPGRLLSPVKQPAVHQLAAQSTCHQTYIGDGEAAGDKGTPEASAILGRLGNAAAAADAACCSTGASCGPATVSGTAEGGGGCGRCSPCTAAAKSTGVASAFLFSAFR